MWGFWNETLEYSKPNADEIIETSKRKFVNEDEKKKWNSSLPLSGGTMKDH